jgi:hypothetical protein
MLYQKGDSVQWKKWTGRIIFTYNDSYIVELYGYIGMTVHRQVPKGELCAIKEAAV